MVWIKIIGIFRPLTKSAINLIVSPVIDVALYGFYKQNLVNLLGGIYYSATTDTYFYVRSKTDDLYYLIPNREGVIEEFILQKTSKGAVFIDIGANIGYYTCLVGKNNPKVKIISIELSPETAKVLKINCRINNIKAVIVTKAAWSRVTQLNFYAPKLKEIVLYGLSSTKKFPACKSFIVKTITLDLLLSIDPTIKTIDMIKIDAEGSEHEILLGAAGILTKTSNIYIECSKELEATVYHYLQAFGFVCQKWEVPHASHLFFSKPNEQEMKD